MKKQYLVIALALCALVFSACKKEGVSLITVGLRDQPSEQKGAFKWVKSINRGQVVKILEKQKDGEWMKVQLPDGVTEGWIQKMFIYEGKKEIVEFSDKTKIYDQPDADSKMIAEIPKGTKGLIIGKKGDWTNVSLSWQQKGWVKQGMLKASSDTKSQAVYEVYVQGIGKCMVEASSSIDADSSKSYLPTNLFDKNPGTTWQEGADGPGIGEWVEITLPDPTNITVAMINGFAKVDPKMASYGADGDLYVLNNRVKSIKVEYWDASDNKNSQNISFEDEIRDFQDAGHYNGIKKIRFTIDSVYKGQKWQDTCLAEIKIERGI